MTDQEIFDAFTEGFGCWTPERRLLKANAAFLRLMGFRPETPFSEFSDAGVLSHAFAEMSGILMHQVDLMGGVKDFEIHLPHKSGVSFWVKADAQRILDAAGKVCWYTAYLTDITSLKLKEAELSHLAFYDALTGLPNRAFLTNRIAAALQAAKRYPDQYALIQVDLDDLYNINQHYGRAFGDMLLRHTAATLLACCRETDTVGRVGSDDFALLLRNPESGLRLVQIIKRICAKFDAPFVLWDQRLDAIPAHFGVIFPLSDYETPEGVLRDAGIAAGRARTGNSSHGYKFFSKKMMEKVRRSLSMSVVLQKKRDMEGFHTLYQPIVQPANNEVHAFETLVRWSHHGRFVPPSTFIPVAEKTGFIKPLGDFVMETACRQLRRWQDEYNAGIDMHVNISPYQLTAHDFPDKVNDILHRTGVDSARLWLEVTESIFLRDFAKALHNINLLRKMGLRFCLDDFGTGYASWGYLKLLPLDCLKIDRSFVSDLEKSAVSRVLVKHIIALSTEMGYNIVVEGVERQTQIPLMGDLDHLLLQGYYFYKPLPIYAVDALLGELYGHPTAPR